ncbi:unnamed protein product [Leptosia nina]|uniref:Uncharacterized protein n=1 Tax=Leptosia nina TaxID=320188 RepID=A0AAV1JGF8_9NEOP
MILTWLICSIVVKEYVDGSTLRVGKKSATVGGARKNGAYSYAPNIKQRTSSIEVPQQIDSRSFSCHESDVFESKFPETTYPLSVLDSTQPFYFLTDAHDGITGPFSKDVQDSYRCLLSKINSYQKTRTQNNFDKNESKVLAVNSVDTNSTQTEHSSYESYYMEEDVIEITNITSYDTELKESLSSNPLNVNIESTNETFTSIKNVTKLYENVTIITDDTFDKLSKEVNDISNELTEYDTIGSTETEDELFVSQELSKSKETEVVAQTFTKIEEQSNEEFLNEITDENQKITSEDTQSSNITYVSTSTEVSSQNTTYFR